MKKQISILITLSLLIGLIVCIATTRMYSKLVTGSTCGQSIYALQNNIGTPINACNNAEYGWPISYVESSSNIYVLNHSSGPAGATVYSYSSFSRLRVGADWLIWSALSGIIVFGGAYLMKGKTPQNKKKIKK